MLKITPKNPNAIVIDYDGEKPVFVIVFWGQDGDCSYEQHVFAGDWSHMPEMLRSYFEGTTYEILTLEQYVAKPYVTIDLERGE